MTGFFFQNPQNLNPITHSTALDLHVKITPDSSPNNFDKPTAIYKSNYISISSSLEPHLFTTWCMHTVISTSYIKYANTLEISIYLHMLYLTHEVILMHYVYAYMWIHGHLIEIIFFIKPKYYFSDSWLLPILFGRCNRCQNDTHSEYSGLRL